MAWLSRRRLLSHQHSLPPHQLVCSAPLQQAEADREDDDHHLDGEEEDDGEDDGGEVGGGQGGDGVEAAIEEEGVVGGGHKDALGVLRYQPVLKIIQTSIYSTDGLTNRKLPFRKNAIYF